MANQEIKSLAQILGTCLKESRGREKIEFFNTDQDTWDKLVPPLRALFPETEMNQDVETIKMVKLRLKKWMGKHGYKQEFSITESDSDGLKHFKCSECKRRLKLNKNADGYSILSNVNRHF